jgi:hypothetical protein
LLLKQCHKVIADGKQSWAVQQLPAELAYKGQRFDNFNSVKGLGDKVFWGILRDEK